MGKKQVDERTKLFMEFFSKEFGVTFVDVDTGEEKIIGDNNDKTSKEFRR